MVKAYPAATVVLMKENESGFDVLLVKRSDELDFCGGAWVFPGGRLDAEDYKQAHSSEPKIVARFAGVREVFEETGIRIKPEQLRFMELHTTPVFSPKRFAAYFFVTSVSTSTVKVDGHEIMDYRWFSPQEALVAHRNGKIYLPLPTMFTLEKLSSFAEIEAVFQAFKVEAPLSD